MPSVISGDANVSATEFGYLDGVTSGLQSQIDAKLATATASSTYLPIAGGKILQVVRATDATERSTTSTSYVDITGMSVTITPQKSDSTIIVIMTGQARRDSTGGNAGAQFRLTDSSNNAISGTEQCTFYHNSTVVLTAPVVLVGYATPATTSATTYKARFLIQNVSASAILKNDQQTGQMFAIEVSA